MPLLSKPLDAACWLAGLVLGAGAALGAVRPLSSGEIGMALAAPHFEQVCLSPDGRYLAYSTGDTVFVTGVDQQAEGMPVFRTPGTVAFVGWARDQLVVADSASFIYRFNADGSGRTVLANPYQLAYQVPFVWSGSFESGLGRSEMLAFNARTASVAIVDPGANTGLFSGKPPPSPAAAGRGGGTGPAGDRSSDDPDPGADNPGRDIDPGLAPSNGDAPQDGVPRAPQVLACDGPSGSLVIEAEGTQIKFEVPTEIFRIDVATGRKTSLARLAAVPQAVLLDQQGNPRIVRVRRGETSAARYLPVGRGELPLPVASELNDRDLLGIRSIPLAYSASGERLYYASNQGRDTYGIYAWNLATNRPDRVRIEDATYDLVDPSRPFPNSGLLFDPATHQLVGVRAVEMEWVTRWLDPRFARVQAALERRLPHRTLRIQSWSTDKTRFLVEADGPARPPRYYVYVADEDRLIQFLRSGPGADSGELSPTTPFVLPLGGGEQLTGYVTEAQNRRLSPPPLVVVLHDGPWSRDLPDYDVESQLISRMGFVVARINYHGSTGFGTRFRDSLGKQWDRRPLDDVDAAVEWLAGAHRIDPRRVAILGHGYGGFVAFRALKILPGHYASAVAIADDSQIGQWLEDPANDRNTLHALDTESIKPSFHLYDYNRWMVSRPLTPFDVTLREDVFAHVPAVFHAASALRRERQVGDNVLVLHPAQPELGVPEMRDLQDFLNLTLYDEHVRVGVPRAEE